MTSLNESGYHKNTSDEKIKPKLPVTWLQGEENRRSDATTEKELTTDEFTMPPLVALQVDKLPISGNLEFASQSTSYSALTDGLAFDEQPTWIIPVIPGTRKPVKLPAPAQTPEAKSYVSLLRNLVTNSGIYAISSLAGPLISLILAPFLTHSLSRTDYGALAVLNTAIALMTGITQFGLGTAFFRAYNYDYESERDKLGVLSTVIILLSLSSIPTAITVLITSPWLAYLLFHTSSLVGPVRLAALVILLQNLTVPGFARLRAESRAGRFASLSIANLLFSLSANIVLVGILHMGINGSLLAIAGGYAFIMLCTLPATLLRTGLHFRFDIAQNLLSFGLPLVSNGIAAWVLQLSDRYLLSRFGSLAQTASYSVAYTLGGVLGPAFLSPFILAWPTTMFAIAKRKDAGQVFRLLFRWYSIVLLFATFALSIVAIVVLNILFPPAYHSAAPVIPVVATSLMFYGLYIVFNAGVGIRRKNWFSVLFLASAALVNVGLNFILIPRYGSMGAAASTLLAYMVLALVARVLNQRIYPIPFGIGTFIIALFVGIILYAGSSILAQTQTTYVAWGIYCSALALYGGCLVLIGKLSSRTQQKFQQTKEDYTS